MTQIWQVHMLGGLRVTSGDTVVTRFRTAKAASLLAYLTLHPDRLHPREELITILWPEFEDEQARAYLSQELYWLRKRFEISDLPIDGTFVADRYNIGINPSVWTTDVAAFEYHARPRESVPKSEQIGLFSQVLTLYAGELLQGYYEEWISSERLKIADKYTYALSKLTALAEEFGDMNLAIEAGNRLLEQNLFDEVHHMLLIRLYAQRGQTAVALRKFKELEAMLSTEFGSKPTQKSLALIEKIKNGEFDSYTTLPAVNEELNEVPKRAALKPSLPISFTRFFGRGEEIGLIKEALLEGQSRLVTLIGMGGCGKTRLAVETTRQIALEVNNAVWFVSLVNLTEPDQIAKAILSAMDVPYQSDAAFDTVVAVLSQRPKSILIFDNCEHILQPGVLVIRQLLEAVPNLTILATSRFRLNIEGEREISVAPLPIPSKGASKDELLANAGLCLLIDRMQSLRGYFEVTPSQLNDMRELCEKLEGIPLSLELAASWSTSLNPKQILSGLSKSFDFLVSQRRDIPERHRSLRTAIDYGYQLLSPELRKFASRLGVFHDGWSLDAAASIGQTPNPFAALCQLVECSMIKVKSSDDDDEPRYEMLESIRDFVLEQLSSQELDLLRLEHAEYYSGRLAPEVRGPDHVIDELATEKSNIFAAIQWCYETGSTTLGLRLVNALREYWRGYVREGIDWVQRFLDLKDQNVPQFVHASALITKGFLLCEQFELVDALQECESAIELLQSDLLNPDLARATTNVALIAMHLGNDERATEMLEKAFGLVKHMKNPYEYVYFATTRCRILMGQNDLEAAHQSILEALQVARELGSQSLEITIHFALGNISARMQKFAAAEQYFSQVLELALRTNRRYYVLMSYLNFFDVAFQQKQIDRSLRYLAIGFRLSLEMANENMIAYSIGALRDIAIECEDYVAAARMFGILENMALSLAGRISTDFPTLSEKEQNKVRNGLTEMQYESDKTYGKILDRAHANAYALSWAEERLAEI